MKNKHPLITIVFILLTATSCQKDLAGNPITVEVYTNDTLTNLAVYSTNETSHCPPPASPAIGVNSGKLIPYIGNGNYRIELDEEASDTYCVTIKGAIPANEDSVGTSKSEIQAFFTEHDNVVGFQNIELKRPHDEYKIVYQFRPDTYIE